MKLAAPSRTKIEIFFRYFFEDENLKLPLVRIHCGVLSRLITSLFKIQGITLGKHIFVAPRHVSKDETGRLVADFDLIVHETAHVLQYQKLGFNGFLFSYFNEWIKFIWARGKRDLETRWQAYYAISHEREARAAAAAYARWRDNSLMNNGER